jgi:hypothetical protein
MVPDLLPSRLKKTIASNGVLADWDTPGTRPTDLGDSDLSLYTSGPRTVELHPDYSYGGSYNPRVWLGTNSIPYEARFDGREVGFTVFAQINAAATVDIFVYETSSDTYHDVNDALGSWFMKWTNNFPHDGALGSWLFTAPEKDLATFIDNQNLVGVLTTINIPQSPYTIDGKGFLTDDKWTVLRTNWITLPEVTLSRNLGIFIQVTYNQPGISSALATTYLTYPALTTRHGFARNNIGHNALYWTLPDVIVSNDSVNSDLNRPLSRIIDVLTHHSDLADEYIDNWAYMDVLSGASDGDDASKSKLVNPDVAPLPSLLWLSQFIGIKRNAVTPTSTAWSGVPATWTKIEDLVDANNNAVVTWSEIETYSPSFSKLIEYLKFAISNGYIGFKAGTEEAIVETVKFFLDNNKVAFIDKNPSGTNRFSVTLYTYLGDTPDATGIGGTSEIVRAAIEISKPIGIEVNHVILADV